MKKLYYLTALLAIFFSSCQQSAILDDEILPASRSVSSNAFVFIDDCNMHWNNDTYMLDYEIIGSSDIPLDKPITLWYRIEYTNGAINSAIFETIPAGITTYSNEGSALGENIASLNGMPNAIISSITYIGYAYNGTMDIIGLDDLNYTPTGGTPSGSGGSSTQTSVLSAEWTKGSYNIGEELKVLTYFDVEGGMGRSYTLISKGALVMEVALTNTTNTTLTYLAKDFAIQHYEWNTTPYSKRTSIFLTNSAAASAVSNISIPAGSTKTVYFYTSELFYEGNGFDYDTTPPYRIRLTYKNNVICEDDINVEYGGNYTEGWK